MKGKMRVLRGEVWAERLGKQLELPPNDAGEWMEQHTQILKSERYSLSGLVRIENEMCFLKFYRPKTVFHRAMFSMGMGAPQRNFTAARDLAADGLAVPVPLACTQLSQGAFLLVEGLSGEGNLADLWRRQPEEDVASQMILAAAKTLAMLHSFGFAHGDCKWDNLFWYDQRAYLVGLDDARRCEVGAPEQARDLARFTINAEELSIGLPLYEQFLNAYLKEVGEPRRELMNRMLPHLYRLRTKRLGRTGGRVQRLV
jgi:tRNA A-37 threonylcarbamoyl transferase component Bud32